MHRICIFLAFIFYVHFSFAEGWRPEEKQILIEIKNQKQTSQLKNLGINFEYYKDQFYRAYVVKKETDKLNMLGFTWTEEISDLNEYYKKFWQTKDAYHSYQEIIDLADSLELEFPNICKKYTFGSSMGGRQLAALKISDNVEMDEPEAEVMFDGGIHGDEIGAAENIIRFARDICIDYNSNPIITDLINNREIWLYLMVNPDGRESMSRYNNNGVDLNRDWPYMWDAWGGSTGPCSQIESKALRACMYSNQFVIHTSYHSGTEYISLPWSYRSDQPADWDHIYQAGSIYSSVSGYPDLDYGQGNSGMYAINGSTKDSNYGIMGSISWSMEISYSKQPPASQIMMYYNYNKPSMLAMIEYAGYGLQGTITDAITGDSIAAIIFVNDYHPTYTDPTAGDYHKYVLPGTYSITVVANGYEPQTIDNIVVTENAATTTDFQLQPANGQFAYKFSSSQIPNNNEDDEGWTPGALGPPDNVNYSIGKSGWVVLDMQYPIMDGAGNDFIVYEGDSSPEGFTCYVGSSIDGPWISLGSGDGTTEFDIAISELPESQFIKIVDDGDGTASTANAGFDLDAIEVLEHIPSISISLVDYLIDDQQGNNNGEIDPGETMELIVNIKNFGDLTCFNTQGEISTSSPYLLFNNDNFLFGDLAQGESALGTFSITCDSETPVGTMIDLILSITNDNGTYTKNVTMSFIIGQIPVLVLDLDENNNSASSIQTAIEDNGVPTEYETSWPSDLSIYQSVFVCLGIYSDNHVLNSSEGEILSNYLNNGGRLYMEGGDTWFYDSQTSVHSMFNINASSDGSGDLETIQGLSGTFTESMSFNYSGENNWIDRIEAIAPALTILENQSPEYGTAVAFDAGTYKTIGASHEFGGLDDGTNPSSITELMYQYLDFFGLIPVPPPQSQVEITALLEGPYFTSEMSSNLNLFGFLPFEQPYNVLPWNYLGNENVASIPNPNIVDWVLVELRETSGDASSAGLETRIARKSGFILKNGSIVDLDGYSPLGFDLEITENLFTIVYHRNHVCIMSANPLAFDNGKYHYDFTLSGLQSLGGIGSQKELAPNIWGMLAGDANSDGEINNIDKDEYWFMQMGNMGYLNGDFDMNGQVDTSDKSIFWENNAGMSSKLNN